MRVEIADSKGCPVPQFIIHAENDQDRLILKAFLCFPRAAKGNWTLRLHSWGGSMDHTPSYDNFNFGWAEQETKSPNLTGEQPEREVT